MGTVMTAFCFTVSGGAIKKTQELGRRVHGGPGSAGAHALTCLRGLDCGKEKATGDLSLRQHGGLRAVALLRKQFRAPDFSGQWTGQKLL